MMKIESIATQTLASLNQYNSITRNSGQPPETAAPAIAEGMGRGDAVVTTTSKQVQPGLQQANDTLNQTAIGIRSDDVRMAQISEGLARMKNYLIYTIKVYPPYPIDDPQRAKFLRSFNGIRQQIEKLTIPPDSKWFGRIPGDVQTSSEPISTGRSIATTAHVQGPPPAATIPQLPDTATDSEIQTTLDKVDQVITTVSAKRQALSQRAGEIGHSLGWKTKATELINGSTEKWDLRLPGSQEAEQKSITVRKEIARVPGSSVPDMLAQLAGLLG
jgi:hypothetical protein